MGSRFQIPLAVQRHAVSGVSLIGDSIFPIGLNGCLSLSVSPAPG